MSIYNDNNETRIKSIRAIPYGITISTNILLEKNNFVKVLQKR